MEKIYVEYILHCVRNSRVLLAQNELLKVDGLLNSSQMSLEKQLQNTSSNSDYSKCKAIGCQFYDEKMEFNCGANENLCEKCMNSQHFA